MAITYRVEKGVELTHEELDNNYNFFDDDDTFLGHSAVWSKYAPVGATVHFMMNNLQTDRLIETYNVSLTDSYFLHPIMIPTNYVLNIYQLNEFVLDQFKSYECTEKLLGDFYFIETISQSVQTVNTLSTVGLDEYHYLDNFSLDITAVNPSYDLGVISAKTTTDTLYYTNGWEGVVDVVMNVDGTYVFDTMDSADSYSAHLTPDLFEDGSDTALFTFDQEHILGSTLLNLSDASNNAVSTLGSPVIVSGKIGECIVPPISEFSGFATPNPVLPTSSAQPFTISYWVYRQSWSCTGTVWCFYTTTTTGGISAFTYIDGTGNGMLSILVDGVGLVLLEVDAGWHNIILSYDGSTLEIYHNNSLVSTTSETIISDGTGFTDMGYYDWISCETSTYAHLDHLRVFNKAVTSTERGILFAEIEEYSFPITSYGFSTPPVSAGIIANYPVLSVLGYELPTTQPVIIGVDGKFDIDPIYLSSDALVVDYLASSEFTVSNINADVHGVA